MSLKGVDKVRNYIKEYLKDEVVILQSSYTIKKSNYHYQMDKVKNLIYIAAVCFLWACGSNGSGALEQQYIPVEPDYKNADMWVCHLNDKNGEGADVFYIPSPWEYDWTTSNGTLCRYADVSNEQHCSNMAIEMNKVAEYMADGNNF